MPPRRAATRRRARRSHLKSVPSRAPGKARAAGAEVTEAAPPTVEFLGHTLTLPARLSGLLVRTIAELETSLTTSPTGALVQTLRVLLGDDTYEQMWATVAAEGASLPEMDALLTRLLEDIYSAYGMAEGESEASEPS